MTPSIIRRFARYYGVRVILPGGPHYELNVYDQLSQAINGRLPWGESHDARDKIVQSLTRIEDAEMLLLAGDGSWSNDYGEGFRASSTSAGIGLLRKAGIDPDKWREVKDEEA
jgi:hypothetical protein